MKKRFYNIIELNLVILLNSYRKVKDEVRFNKSEMNEIFQILDELEQKLKMGKA